MILTCPECGTRYRADAAQFPPAGRKVRCAKCGHLWHQAAQDADRPPAVDREIRDTAAAPPASAAPFAISSAPAMRTRRAWGETLGIVSGWAGLCAMLCLAGWTGFRFRQEIVALWPQSASLYELAGVAVNASGIEIVAPSWRREMEGGEPVLAVTGRLVNISPREVAVPPIRVALIGSNEREICHWMFNSTQPTLRPGQTMSFLTRLPGPPAGARHMELRLAEGRP